MLGRLDAMSTKTEMTKSGAQLSEPTTQTRHEYFYRQSSRWVVCDDEIPGHEAVRFMTMLYRKALILRKHNYPQISKGPAGSEEVRMSQVHATGHSELRSTKSLKQVRCCDFR